MSSVLQVIRTPLETSVQVANGSRLRSLAESAAGLAGCNFIVDEPHLVMPMSVVIAVSYTGRTSSGVGFANVAADSGMSISFRHGSRSWSAKIGKEYCCDITDTHL